MRRLILLFLLLLTACQPAPVRQPTFTPVPSPTPAPDFTVTFHPDGEIHVGDQVSIEVITPTDFATQNKQVEARAGETKLGSATFGGYGIAGRNEAVFYWMWDTTGLEPGTHTLDFTVTPDGRTFQATLNLLPVPETVSGKWEIATTDCCTINYISGTESERDIESLKNLADGIAADVSKQFSFTLEEKIPIVLMSRTLGHGGFTREAIYVSYLDRNYAGSTTAQVLEHEMVHWFDAQKGGELRPTLFVEGLAVYLSGGHFKPEPLIPRAAALIDMGWYIPLRTLADNFYPSQHEIGYLEAGALIEYMVDTYGWDAFETFYRSIKPQPGGKESDAIDAGLKASFGITFDELERNFTEYLGKQLVDEPTREDVRLTVRFYDTVRRYQQLLDPSAYFQTAWLPDASQMRQRNITADYQRHPDSSVNRYFEEMLVTADSDLRAGDYAETSRELDTLNIMLNIYQGMK